MNLPKLLTPKQTAQALGCSEASLASWRSTKRVNLPWVKIASRVMYREADIILYIEERTRTITA